MLSTTRTNAPKTFLLRAGAVFCAAALLFCAMAQPASAETAAEKYNRLKEELEGISADIDAAKADKQEAEKLKESLARQKEVVEEMIALKNEEIVQTELAMQAKDGEIAQKRKVIYENDQLFQERLVAIYKMNTTSGLSQLFNVDSFAELMQLMDALQRISKHDTDLLDELNVQREELEAELAEIDAMRTSLQEAYDEMEVNKNVLAGNIAAQDERISAAEAEQQALEVAKVATNEELEKAQAEMIAAFNNQGGSSQGDGSQYVGGVFMWPVPNYFNISCYFGSPDPNGSPHRGMDIHTSGTVGPPIVACGNGMVITAEYGHYSYGNYVVIDHGDGIKTLYAHCNSLNVSVGKFVSTGEQIATVGSTGFSTGPHLHLEVWAGGGLADPLAYLKG